MGIPETISRRFSVQPMLPYSGSKVAAALGADVPEHIRQSLTDVMNCLGRQWGGTEFTLMWNNGRPALVSGEQEIKIRGENPAAACWAVFALSDGVLPDHAKTMTVSVCNANQLLFSQSLTEVLRKTLSEAPNLGNQVKEIASRELGQLVRSVPQFHLHPLRSAPRDCAGAASLKELYGLESGDFSLVLEAFLEARRVTIPGYENALRRCVSDLKGWLYTQSIGNLRVKLDTINPEIQDAQNEYSAFCLKARNRELDISLPFERGMTPRMLEGKFGEISAIYTRAARAGIRRMFLADIKESILGDEAFWTEVSQAQERVISACSELGMLPALWSPRELPAYHWHQQLDVSAFHFDSVAWDPSSAMRLHLQSHASRFLVSEGLFGDPKINEAFKAASKPVPGLPEDIIIKMEVGQI